MRKAKVVGIALAILLGACGGSDPPERPVAAPGEIETVVDEDTYEVFGILTDLAAGADGTLYLAYVGPSDRIVAVPRRGEARVLAAGGKSFPSPVSFRPTALALDRDSETLYVADDEEGWIRAINRDGERRNVMQLSPGPPGGPDPSILEDLRYLAYDQSSGLLYVASTCQVARVDLDRKKAGVIAGVPCAKLVGDRPDRSERVLREGATARNSEIDGVYGLAVDPQNGDVLLSIKEEPHGGAVYRINIEGRVTLVLGGTGTPKRLDQDVSSRFLTGGDLSFDPRSGDLYIACPVDSVIRRWSRDGKFLTIIAGSGEYVAAGDGGPAGKANVDAPARLAIDDDGNVYFNGEHDGSSVRMIGS